MVLQFLVLLSCSKKVQDFFLHVHFTTDFYIHFFIVEQNKQRQNCHVFLFIAFIYLVKCKSPFCSKTASHYDAAILYFTCCNGVLRPQTFLLWL